MAALLVSHRRPGFYCRVVTEGEVEAGQAIDKITAGPEGVTVAEIDALLYLPGRPRDTLTRALRIPALSPGWKRSLQQLLEHGADNAAGNSGLTGTTATPPAWPGFRPLCATSTHAHPIPHAPAIIGRGLTPQQKPFRSLSRALREDGRPRPPAAGAWSVPTSGKSLPNGHLLPRLITAIWYCRLSQART